MAALPVVLKICQQVRKLADPKSKQNQNKNALLCAAPADLRQTT